MIDVDGDPLPAEQHLVVPQPRGVRAVQRHVDVILLLRRAPEFFHDGEKEKAGGNFIRTVQIRRLSQRTERQAERRGGAERVPVRAGVREEREAVRLSQDPGDLRGRVHCSSSV